jgi:DHA1 family tetracycline resistance protein-like MFS transporter
MPASTVTPAAPAALRFVLLSVLLSMLGAGLVVPVLPALFEHYGLAPGQQAVQYGLMLACYGLAQLVAAPLMGALSDRYGRRPLLLLGMAGLGLDFALMPFAPSLGWLLLLRVLGGLAASGGAVAAAYVADVTAPAQRTRAMGALAAMFGLGLVFGPLLGGLLGLWHRQAPFLAAAALCLINLCYGWRALPESLLRRRQEPLEFARLLPWQPLQRLWRQQPLRRPLVVFALAQLAQMLVQASWVISTGRRFGWGPAMTGGSLCFAGLLAGVMQGALLSRATARWGETGLLRLALVLAVCSQCLYAWVPQGWMMFAVMLLALPCAAGVPLLQSGLSRQVDAAAQGELMGALAALRSAAGVLAPLPAGALLALAEQAGRPWTHAFGLPFVAAGAGLAVAWWLGWSYRPERSSGLATGVA